MVGQRAQTNLKSVQRKTIHSPSAQLMLTVAHQPLAFTPEVKREALHGPCRLVQQRADLKCEQAEAGKLYLFV